jgi:hypothetical protein
MRIVNMLGIIEPCKTCRVYNSQLRSSALKIYQGDYAAFQELGILLDSILEEPPLDEYGAISKICEGCHCGLSVYDRTETEGFKKLYEDFKEQLGGKTDEEITRMLMTLGTGASNRLLLMFGVSDPDAFQSLESDGSGYKQ